MGVVDINSFEKDPEFEKYADEVYKEITEYNYVKVEFKETSDYTPMVDYAWYDIYSVETIKNGKVSDENPDADRTYVRYIQREGEYYTNHEYIIGYDGNGYDRDNMTSITESDVNYDHEPIEEHISKIYENWEYLELETIPIETDGMYDTMVNYTESTAFDIGAWTYALDPDYDVKIFRYLPVEYNGVGDEQLWFRYHMTFTGGKYSELYLLTDEINLL